jgi:hypothetical protein
MSVPVFFKKEDFYGILLPGYATVILAGYFFGFNSVSDDISATVLFIIVGPVIGYILSSVTSIMTHFGDNKYDLKDLRKFLSDYAKLRIFATERQISELDDSMSTYQFCISTGPAFIILSIVKIVALVNLQVFLIRPLWAWWTASDLAIPVLTLFGGIVLLWVAKYEYEKYTATYLVLYDEIMGSHNSKSLDGFKMACIYPDGRLTDSCKKILSATKEPLSPEEIATASDSPLFKVRSSIRELTDAGLMEERFGKYVITSRGEEKLKE